MKLSVLLKQVQHEFRKNDADPDIKGIAYDSRMVKPGFLFFALRGRNQDGNRFIEDAVSRGALAVVSDEPSFSRSAAPVGISVPDARTAMAFIACAFHGHPSDKLRVVGITGTNGKTTVAFMIRNILAAAGIQPGMLGTIQYEIGDRTIPAQRTTPESPDIQDMLAQMVRVGCRSAVMEVSSHALLQQRVLCVEFNVAVFTNLTQDHLDYHGCMDDYFQAKTLLFPPCSSGSKPLTAIINLDDPWGAKLASIVQQGQSRLVTYGMHPDAMVCAKRLKVGSGGSEITVAGPWGETGLSLKLLGRFNISNALAAFACCVDMGVEPSAIAGSLAAMDSVRGRLELVPVERDFSVFVDYAHTEDALRNVLTTLREITSGRLIVVFGCGGNRDRKKRPLMGAVVGNLADHSILTSDNPRKEEPSTIIAEIEKGFEGKKNYEVIPDRREAIGRGLAVAGKGDVVLIAGKGHEIYQEQADRTVPFDDREVVASFTA